MCAPTALAGSEQDRDQRRTWIGGFVAVAVIGGLVPVLIASHYGALGIPRGDDWSYLVTLFRWVDEGRLGFNHWAATPLIGQLVVAAPVAALRPRSIDAVHVLSAVVGVVALVAVIAAGRRVVPLRAAVLVAVTIAASPVWIPLAATYMTDHWAFAAEMVALACALESFRRTPSSTAWLAAAVAAGAFGVTIRQYAIVPVVAILLAAFVDALVRGDRRRLRVVLVLTAAFVVAVAVLFLWWVGRPGVDNLAPRRPDRAQLNATVKTALGYVRVVGLLLVPVVVLADPRRIVRRAWAAGSWATIVIGGGVAALLVLDYVRAPAIPFVGDYVARSGVLGVETGIRGPRPDAIPALAFDALVWIGMASATLLVLRALPAVLDLRRRVRERAWPDAVGLVLGLQIVGFAVVSTVTVLVDLRGFDRYALPVLPVVAFAVLREPAAVPARAPVERATRRRFGWAYVVVGLLAVVGMAYAAESSSFDATRWEVAERATRAGYTPLEVDGGFEWVAWHRRTGPPYGPKLDPAERARAKRAFERPFCVRVAIASGPLPADRVATGTSDAPTRDPVTFVAYPLPGKCTDRG